MVNTLHPAARSAARASVERFMKELGVGMALAIALDATIARALLVPARMRLMGHWNWWAPKPLLRIWQRAELGDLEGHAPAPATGD